MTEETVLGTSIPELPMTAGLRKPHPPSAMTLGGLLEHLALVEAGTPRSS